MTFAMSSSESVSLQCGKWSLVVITPIFIGPELSSITDVTASACCVILSWILISIVFVAIFLFSICVIISYKQNQHNASLCWRVNNEILYCRMPTMTAVYIQSVRCSDQSMQAPVSAVCSLQSLLSVCTDCKLQTVVTAACSRHHLSKSAGCCQ